jgi:hypothetical protein
VDSNLNRMIVFCGDSWVQDEQKENQWTTLLTKKLYNNDITSHYYNFAEGGTGVDNLLQEQLINKALPLCNKSKVDYLIVGISYSMRFSLLNKIYYQPSNEDGFDVFYNSVKSNIDVPKNDLKKYYDSLIFFNTFFYKDSFSRYMKSINTILNYIESLGTKIIAFHVDNQEDEYQLDDKFYIKGKTLKGYYKFESNKFWELNMYSNHISEHANIDLANKIFDELKN